MTDTQRKKLSLTMRGLRVGKSQLQIATLANMPERRYWQIENGYLPPTKDEKARIAKAMGVTQKSLPTWPKPKAARR